MPKCPVRSPTTKTELPVATSCPLQVRPGGQTGSSSRERCSGSSEPRPGQGVLSNQRVNLTMTAPERDPARREGGRHPSRWPRAARLSPAGRDAGPGSAKAPPQPLNSNPPRSKLGLLCSGLCCRRSRLSGKRMCPCGCFRGWPKRSAEEGEGVPSLASQRGNMIHLLATCAPRSSIPFLTTEQLPLP